MIVGPHQSDSAAGAVATASTVSNDERAMLAPQAFIYTLFMCFSISYSFEDMRHDYPQSQWGTTGEQAAGYRCGLRKKK